ncbi:Mobile element protein (plasmid) [Candidatus Enterovibrio altilux]|uniref:Mobile element protein n=1 Tax=Candidatus Enterovibrio altilux TaxID=1927128 RepID=A0A291BAV2_9GAMM|nr:Mobile element protein [Candidatus Enterovibrio luxaltus]
MNTHQIITAKLSASNVTDGKMILNFLEQTRRRINSISGDAPYDNQIILRNHSY